MGCSEQISTPGSSSGDNDNIQLLLQQHRSVSEQGSVVNLQVENNGSVHTLPPDASMTGNNGAGAGLTSSALSEAHVNSDLASTYSEVKSSVVVMDAAESSSAPSAETDFPWINTWALAEQ